MITSLGTLYSVLWGSMGVAINELRKFLRGVAKSEELTWVLSECEEVGGDYILLKFKVTNTKYLRNFNIVFRCTYGSEGIPSIKLEIVISTEYPAPDFLQRVYGKLVESGAEVALSSDGVFVYYKLSGDGLAEKIKEKLKYVVSLLKDNEFKIMYVGYEVLRSWASST